MSGKRRRRAARSNAGARPARSRADTRPAGKPAPRPSLSGPRLWLFRGVAVVVAPLLCVCLLELGLRIVGSGFSPDVTVACEVDGVAHRGDNLSFSRRFFPARLAREFEPFVFPSRKPHGTCRIFVLGASAAQGVPNHAFRFARILEVMLRERFGDARCEVITAAMAAINSHVVLEIAKGCAKYEPDLFVVYLGNNEVVGPYGPGTVLTSALSNLRLIRLGIAMRTTRLGQLLDALVQALGRRGDGPESWQGMEMFLGQEVRAEDPRLETVYDHFRRNLRDICRIADKAGAQTVLCTVGANVRDCPPFASRHEPGLTPEQQANWDRLYRQGAKSESNGDFAEAIQAYQQAVQIDDSYADLPFRVGRCYWQLGEYDKATEQFVQARDLDALRFRADTRINEVIRTVATEAQARNVWLADVVTALRDGSPQGAPGEEFFLEHVHLTFEGNYVVARTIFEQLEPILLERLGGAERPGDVPTLELCAQRLMHSDWSRHQTLDAVVHSFLAKPPFTGQLYHEQRVAVLQQRLDALRERLTPDALQAIAGQYEPAIQQAPDDWRLHWDHGKLLAENLKQYDPAAAEYRIVQRLLPHSYTGYNALGSVLRAKGDLEGAIAEYHKTLAIKPMAGDARYHLGWCYQKQGQMEAAVNAYRRTIRLAPDWIPAYLSLGELLFKQGQLAEAIRVCRAGLAVAPNHPLLHSNLGMLLIQTGQRQEGTKEIRRALELDPNSAQIRKVAETLLGPQRGR